MISKNSPTPDIIHCVGMAQDELDRTDRKTQIKKGNVMYPLISDYIHDPSAVKYCYDRDCAMTEKEALEFCYSRGFDWEGLYEKFHRVSCFCCPQKRFGELWTVYDEYPELWDRMIRMENSMDNSKHYITFQNKQNIMDLTEIFRFKKCERDIANKFLVEKNYLKQNRQMTWC